MEMGNQAEPNKPLTNRSQTETQRAERLGWIIDQLSIAAMAKGQVFTPERLRVNAEDLIDIPQGALLIAFQRARRELEFAPGVADIRRFAIAEEEGDRPGVELAWAMCPRSEEASVVWTSEMAEAFGMCRSLLMNGDEIAARMVFKEQYPFIVSRARATHLPVEWIVSLGWDQGDRVRALSDAIQRKRITAEQALGLLGAEQQDELLQQLPTAERKMLTGNVKPNLAVLSGLNRAIANLREHVSMSELEPTPPKKESSAEERAAYAQRVREQAAELKKRQSIG
jgi:hypothetical protein